MPTDSAASRPLRVEDGRVALVRLVEDRRRRGARDVLAISKQTVSMPPRIDLGGDGIDGRRLEMRPRLPARRTKIDVRHGGPPRT